MPSSHEEMLRQIGMTAEQWKALRERVRKRRERQEPFRALIFEEYVRGFVDMARERYFERMEQLRQQEEKEQPQPERDSGEEEQGR